MHSLFFLLLLGNTALFSSFARAALSWKTFDISSLAVEEKKGVTYQDASSNTMALETMVAAVGANSVKIRVWVNPSDGVYGLDYGVELGKRAAAAGLDVVLNLHYSDTWTDAGTQTMPSEWASLSIDALASEVQMYTQNVLDTFTKAGVNVSLVGLGNEIRSGLLFPLGKNANGFTNMAKILSAAVAGVRASSSSSTLTMFHLDEGYDWVSQKWWYDSLASSGFDMSTLDVQGLSYYPYWNKEDSTLSNFNDTVTNMANTYGKKVVVVETDWPTSCPDASSVMPPSLSSAIPFSAAGQVQWMKNVADILESLKVDTGLMYWEPAWVDNASLGSSCSSNVMFSVTWSGSSAKATAMSSFTVFQDL